MSAEVVLAISSEMLWTALLIGAPILGFSMLVGLLISILQVVTQVQEISLTFVPKIVTVGATLLTFGPWMLNKLVQFASTIIGNIPIYF